MGFLRNILGSSVNKDKVKKLLTDGAVVIDVRTPAEFQGGHVSGSKNIPLQKISSMIDQIAKIDKPIVLCCASGARSNKAASLLQSNGIECENGGGWMAVNGMMQ